MGVFCGETGFSGIPVLASLLHMTSYFYIFFGAAADELHLTRQ